MALECKLKEIRMQEYLLDNKSEFARILGVGVHTYIKWEDKISRPKLETAIEISRKLNRTVEDIWYPE